MPALRLSIRTTLLATIVVAMLLPALLVLAIDGVVARRTQQPIVERNRQAVMVLAAAVMAEPAWTLSEPALQAAVNRIVNEPSVCAVEVLDLQPLAKPLGRDECAGVKSLVTREAPVLHEGKAIARLRLAFDDSEIDHLLAERRAMTAWLVAAQVLFGAAVLLLVLSNRLLRPIDRLKRQAGRLASREPEPKPESAMPDELGQLGQHLHDMQARVRSLIDELEAKNAQLERMAMYDHLTGLPNRILLRELFLRAAATARRDGHLMAMLFVDLDHFKSVNDQLGHAAGDELLVVVSRRLRDALRESDAVCRLGGDEFVAMLPQVEGWEQACATADRVLATLRQPLLLSGGEQPVHVDASIGVAMYPADGTEFDDLAHAADLAMYRSKDLGRGRYSLYHAEMDVQQRSRLQLEAELAEAVQRQQLRLYAQPLVNARDGRVIGAEALVRWQHPQQGLLAPEDFIGAAEGTGVIVELGRWVLDAACAALARWHAQGRRDLTVSINMSALQLQDAGFADAVRQAMRRHALPAGALTLELTESTLLADSEGVLRAMAQLRAAGAKLAIDHFGTGYSSLSALKRVRPDLLKIGHSFVRELPDGKDERALAEAVFGMAGTLGIAVVAAGVETAAQRDWLLERGAWRQQGFLWAQPVPAADFLVDLAA